MTRIVITGANGQLGRELVRFSWPAGYELRPYTSAELDITDVAAVSAAVDVANPDVIVNAAAYTAVDRAEDDEERAMAVNATAVEHLARAADRADALLVHLSTDYVFDGTKADWYTETDPLAPLGVYGRTKAAGEAAAAKAAKSVTLRTAWVYGALGSNFVTTMLRLAGERSELGVVDDQVGCPTSAADLAAAIAQLIEATEGGRVQPPATLYHLASPDSATWHEFAMAIFETSAAGFAGTCNRLTTAEYPTRAVRPANSRLASHQIATDLGIELPSWRRSLPRVVAELEGSPLRQSRV